MTTQFDQCETKSMHVLRVEQLAEICECGCDEGVIVDQGLHHRKECKQCGKYVTWVKKAPAKREGINGSTRRAVRSAANNACHYCHRRGDDDSGPDGRSWHIDHKHPVSLGGSNELSNLVLSCASCNLAKSDTPYEEFVALHSLTRLAPIVLEDIRSLLRWRVGVSGLAGRRSLYLYDTSQHSYDIDNGQLFDPDEIMNECSQMLHTLSSAHSVLSQFMLVHEQGSEAA